MSESEFLDFETNQTGAATILPTEDGGADVIYDSLTDEVDMLEVETFVENLAENMDEEELKVIGELVCETYESDLQSRNEWEQITIDALDNLGIRYDESAELFDGACGATHPLILENSIKFQSKASNELLPASGPVKTRIIGQKSSEVEARAKRVKDDMNYQTQFGIPEYYDETDRNLFFMAFLGNGFKRKYIDFERGRICDEMVLPDRLVVNNGAKNLRSAERISFLDRVSPNKMERRIDSGYYADVPLYGEDSDYGLGNPYQPNYTDFEQEIRTSQGIDSSDNEYDNVYEIIEQHVWLRLEDDELARPYIVTVEKESRCVLAIYRNWDQDDPSEERLDWYTHYPFIPNAGFYAWGYTHILGNLQRTMTVMMRSLADAGQFANLPAGFKTENARIVGDNDNLTFGEFRDVDLPAIVDDIRKVFMPLPFKEPSQVLFAMFEKLEGIGQKFADSTEQVIADSTNYGPVGTTMALLEASTKFFASVYKRAHQAQAHEFKIIARLVYEYLPDEYPYVIDPEENFSRHEDYDPDTIDIIPVSDPNYSSQAQRITKAQTIFQTALQTAQYHDMYEVLKEFYKSLEVENMDKLLPPPEEPKMQDPLTDILSALRGKPIAAFKGQDHQSHILIKSAWLQDPSNGASEQMMAIQPVIRNNINEHTFLAYSEQMETIAAQEKLSVEQAAQRVMRLNQIAKEEEEKGSPASRIADAEVMKAQADMMKEARESKNDQSKLGLDLLRLATDVEELKIKAKEVGADIDMKQLELASKMIAEGFKAVNEKEKMDNDKWKSTNSSSNNSKAT